MSNFNTFKVYKLIGFILIYFSLLNFLSQSSWAIIPEIEKPFKYLMDNNKENDTEAIRQLKQLLNVDKLIIKELQNNPNPEIRKTAIIALRELDVEEKKHVALLIKVLQEDEDNDVQTSAIISLGKIGASAEASVQYLIDELDNKHQPIRVNSVIALGQIAPTQLTTIRAFINALQDQDSNVKFYAANNLGEALSKIDAVESKNVLNNALEEVKKALDKRKDWQIRIGAAQALGSSGRDVKLAINILSEALQNNNEDICRNALRSLSYIPKSLNEKATSLTSEERLNAKEGLQQAIKALDEPQDIVKNLDENLDEVKKSLKNSLAVITAIPEKSSINQITQLICDNYKVSIPTAIVIFWFSLVLTSLWTRPLLLLRLSDFLQRYTDIPIPNFLGGIKLSTLRLLLFGAHYHPRVLDAWVKSKIEIAHKEFQKKQTVRERAIHISIPVVLDGRNIDELTPKHLQSNFAEQRECLLIWGEGGSGKTSLACQLAQWAMSSTPDQRLCKHQMLPILVEQELDFKVPEGKQAFTQLIGGLLRDLIDAPEPISEELLEQLVQQQRLLVIIDRFSEMSQDTRNQIRPELPGFPVNALVVTSRIEERLGGVNKTILKPMRVAGNRLSSFMEAYLTKHGKRELFDDQEFFAACSRLSAIVGKGNLTVLLAKLYADQMIATKTVTTRDDLPDNVPDLMLDYLKQLNRSVAENPLDTHAVQHDAKIIAWECLRQTYQPTTAKRDAVLVALGGENTKTRLAYLENRLRIIQTIGPSENQIRFSLDPLAEYLASLYLVENYADNKEAWRDFLGKLDVQQGVSKTIQGFILAVYDCCLVKGRETKVPDFVLTTLGKQVNLVYSKLEITNQ